MNNLKEKYMKKLKKTAGFTLVEMLIVVAIIAILIAISIPMVSKSLEKAKRATDAANERSAKAAALILYMTDEKFDATKTYYYNAVKGELQDGTDGIQGYGQCPKHKNGYLKVTIDEDGLVTDLVWEGDKVTKGDHLDSENMISDGNKKS